MNYVTIAICTWNRAALLDQTLAGMRELEIPGGIHWELLIINNNCTDDTDLVIDRHRDALPIRRVFEPAPGHSNARNRAIQEAQGDLILWTDDDVLVDPKWLTALVAASERHPSAGAFGGPIEPWFPVEPDPHLFRAFPELRSGFCGNTPDHPEGPIEAGLRITGANMAHRTAALGDLRYDHRLGMVPSATSGGRNASVGGYEEFDLNERLIARGHQIVWVPEMRVRHYVDPLRMRLDYLLRYVREHGSLKVRLGFPDTVVGPDVKKIYGLPRYLVRRFIESRTRSVLYRCKSRRTESFIHLRQAFIYLGFLREYRAMQRTPRTSQ